jgi:protein-tyrosine phosphatase
MELVTARKITKDNPYSMLFVCLGNICRSPTAEGIMQHMVKERGYGDYFYIDSAGTAAYHIGEAANSKSQATANKYGVQLHSRGRQFVEDDFSSFDLILAMDIENFKNIRKLDRGNDHTQKVFMMRSFDPQPGDLNVPDPYYGGMDGFELVFQVLQRSCDNLLNKLTPHIE